MDVFEEIDYWINTLQEDLKCYETEEKKETVKNLFYAIANQGLLNYFILKERKGIIAYCITPDYRGDLTLNELFLYIKSEHRGSFKLFKELINHIEKKAKENKCKTVRIGANLNYKDEKILRALNTLGYKADVVVKQIGDK